MRLSVPRSHFNELAREGNIRHWREAFESGTVRATGPTEILRLISQRGREAGGAHPQPEAAGALSSAPSALAAEQRYLPQGST